jgi:glucokinase
MRKYLIGVDVGGTSVKFGKFDLAGELLEKWSIHTNTENKGSSILKDIVDSIKEYAKLSEVKGIGIGLPGPVTNNIVLNCVNLGWGRKNIEEELREILKDNEIAIKAANDANAAAAGEMYKGIAKGYDNVVLFTLGTGVGGGIIIDDKLVEGINGVAGELGHMTVDDIHKFSCNCGKVGCLETVASATGIVSLAKANLKEYSMNSPLRRYPTFSAKKVFDYAKQGDLISEKTIDEAMRYLAKAMSLVTYTINPDVIVIGGGVSNAGDYIIEKIEKYYYDFMKPFVSQTNFAIATLGNEAGIYGCCYLVK